MTDTLIIDSHAHFFPKTYLKAMNDLGIHFGQSLDDRFTSIQPRLNDMEKAGVSMQAISIAVPGVNMSTPENAVTLAKIVNDGLAKVTADDDRFIGLASLPMIDPDAAIEELDRAVNDLSLRGVEVFTNVGGKTLDHPSFFPIYEEISRHNIPIFIHPNAPAHREIYDDYGLLAVLGFPFETTHAATRIALSGLLERLPDLKLVLSHLGGTLPYLVGRIDDAYRMFGSNNPKIRKPPSEYLKKMYLDGASFYSPAWKCAMDFWSVDKIVMGSDYPYGWVGDYSGCVDTVNSLNISDYDKSMILHENAAKLLNLDGE